MSKQNKRRPPCQICTEQPFKYTCPRCSITYCSLGCYRLHKGSCPETTTTEQFTDHQAYNQVEDNPPPNGDDTTDPQDQVPLRPLTSLRWPYAPEESAFPDPLKRDDPKPLQLPQYEAIASSAEIRRILASHEQLPELLTSIDKLRGEEREFALQKALGVTPADLTGQLEVGGRKREVGEDVLAFRKLAEAIEEAVRGGNHTLGLDWGD